MWLGSRSFLISVFFPMFIWTFDTCTRMHMYTHMERSQRSRFNKQTSQIKNRSVDSRDFYVILMHNLDRQSACLYHLQKTVSETEAEHVTLRQKRQKKKIEWWTGGQGSWKGGSGGRAWRGGQWSGALEEIVTQLGGEEKMRENAGGHRELREY